MTLARLFQAIFGPSVYRIYSTGPHGRVRNLDKFLHSSSHECSVIILRVISVIFSIPVYEPCTPENISLFSQ